MSSPLRNPSFLVRRVAVLGAVSTCLALGACSPLKSDASAQKQEAAPTSRPAPAWADFEARFIPASAECRKALDALTIAVRNMDQIGIFESSFALSKCMEGLRATLPSPDLFVTSELQAYIESETRGAELLIQFTIDRNMNKKDLAIEFFDRGAMHLDAAFSAMPS